jgi:hypothetical protein
MSEPLALGRCCLVCDASLPPQAALHCSTACRNSWVALQVAGAQDTAIPYPDAAAQVLARLWQHRMVSRAEKSYLGVWLAGLGEAPPDESESVG